VGVFQSELRTGGRNVPEVVLLGVELLGGHVLRDPSPNPSEKVGFEQPLCMAGQRFNLKSSRCSR
jgi:hypothetical protein